MKAVLFLLCMFLLVPAVNAADAVSEVSDVSKKATDDFAPKTLVADMTSRPDQAKTEAFLKKLAYAINALDFRDPDAIKNTFDVTLINTRTIEPSVQESRPEFEVINVFNDPTRMYNPVRIGQTLSFKNADQNYGNATSVKLDVMPPPSVDPANVCVTLDQFSDLLHEKPIWLNHRIDHPWVVKFYKFQPVETIYGKAEIFIALSLITNCICDFHFYKSYLSNSQEP